MEEKRKEHDQVDEHNVLVFRSVMNRQMQQSDSANRGESGGPAATSSMIVDAERPKEERERGGDKLNSKYGREKKERKRKKREKED